MFVQIGDRRIKISSIQEFYAAGMRQNGRFVIEIKISNAWRNFHFDSPESYELVLKNLDDILKVKSV